MGTDHEIKVTRDGRLISELPAERVLLDFPELSGRPEVNIALAPSGDIWAAIGQMTASCRGIERLFRSQDGGRIWTSHVLQLTENRDLVAFTVLRDGGLLLVCKPPWQHRQPGSPMEVYSSPDGGSTWELISQLGPEPFLNIGEGFLSLTELRDGTLLLPVCCWNTAPEGTPQHFPHYVFRSSDGGKTWQSGIDPDESDVAPVGDGPGARWPGMGGTFPGCVEAHILESSDNQLLGAFRYSGHPQPWHKEKSEEWGGGGPDGLGRLFKHVFLANSSDGGRTWHDLRPVLDSRGRALVVFGECHGQLAHLPSGQILLTHDHRYPYERNETISRVSNDGGKTWLRNVYHISEGQGYAASAVLDDGVIVTVTGATRLDSESRSIEPWQAHAVRWRIQEDEGDEG